MNNIASLRPLTGVITLGVERISFSNVGVNRNNATNQSSISALNLPESTAPFNPTWRSISFAPARLIATRAVIGHSRAVEPAARCSMLNAQCSKKILRDNDKPEGSAMWSERSAPACPCQFCVDSSKP